MGFKHEFLEKNSIILSAAILVVVAIGGLVQMAPLAYLKNTIEKVDGMRPYTPLELAGRKIYVREGCYLCHSQMVRPLRDEVERYGHYSLAAESMYDHPFQWGSKRTGPDLARLGGKYSDSWHLDHLRNPRSVVPESVMPPYAFLERPLNYERIAEELATNRTLGTPYTDEMIENAIADLEAQADPDSDWEDMVARYEAAAGREGSVQVRAFDGNPSDVTEMDALIAYVQMLGTLVDFSTYQADDLHNLR